MKIVNVKDLTPEQIEELRTPIPCGEVLKKKVEIGIGADVVLEVEEALIPARATQEFRQSLGQMSSGDLANILGRPNMEEPTARFVFRIAQRIDRSIFKGWDAVRDKMTAAQIKHVFAIAVRVSYYPSDDMVKESQDFFSKAVLIPSLMDVEGVMAQLEAMNAMFDTVGINAMMTKVLLDKVNEIARRMGLDEVKPPSRSSLDGETSESEKPSPSSSTDSQEEDHPAEPSSISPNTM